MQWDPVQAEPSLLKQEKAHRCLAWLFSTPQMFRHTDSLFPILLQTLSDESDEVGQQPLPLVLGHPASPLDWLMGSQSRQALAWLLS